VPRPATAARDPRIAHAAALLRSDDARREHGAFVLDGDDLLAEALAAGISVSTVFAADPDAVACRPAPRSSPRAPMRCARSRSRASRRPSPPCAGRPPSRPACSHPRRSCSRGWTGAGNVGSILRTAAALGLPRVALTPGCADPWSRRALRAALGASFAPGLVARDRPLERLAAGARAPAARRGGPARRRGARGAPARRRGRPRLRARRAQRGGGRLLRPRGDDPGTGLRVAERGGRGGDPRARAQASAGRVTRRRRRRRERRGAGATRRGYGASRRGRRSAGTGRRRPRRRRARAQRRRSRRARRSGARRRAGGRRRARPGRPRWARRRRWRGGG
jgi:TrmH family RNA methyltransferase